MDQFSRAAVDQYEQALLGIKQNGGTVKSLLLCHPHNPLGRCYTREALVGYMELCKKYRIHLIMDEIYALSVFDVPDPEATRFESISTFDTDKYIHPDYLHLLYGMSKDTAAGGIRLGCLYTRNLDLRKALGTMSMFHWSGNVTERLTIAMLEDEKWMDTFLKSSVEKLAERNKMVKKMFDAEGVKYYTGANAGFFLWLDLRPFLPSVQDSKDSDGWDREDALTKKLLENRVYITDGRALSAEEPGWYRLIFSRDEKIIQEGFRRYRLPILNTAKRVSEGITETDLRQDHENPQDVRGVPASELLSELENGLCRPSGVCFGRQVNYA